MESKENNGGPVRARITVAFDATGEPTVSIEGAVTPNRLAIAAKWLGICCATAPVMQARQPRVLVPVPRTPGN